MEYQLTKEDQLFLDKIAFYLKFKPEKIKFGILIISINNIIMKYYK